MIEFSINVIRGDPKIMEKRWMISVTAIIALSKKRAISHYYRSRTTEINAITFLPQYNPIFRHPHRL